MSGNKNTPITSERIGKLRVAASESQQDLANSLGVKRETVKFWESGERQIKAADIASLATHFNVSADYLLGLSNVKANDPERKAVCEYTGLTEEAINQIRSFPIEHLFSKLGIPLSKWAASAEDRLYVFNALLQSNNFSSDVLGPLTLALTYKKSLLNILNTDLPEHSFCEFEEIMLQQNELCKNLKYEIYDAVEGFRRLVETTFSFEVTVEQSNRKLEAWYTMHYDHEKAIETRAEHGEHQED